MRGAGSKFASHAAAVEPEKTGVVLVWEGMVNEKKKVVDGGCAVDEMISTSRENANLRKEKEVC